MEVKQKKEVVLEKRLPLQISNYDDIFSGFDPRPFDHRALSVDFVEEAKRATRDKGEGIELKFFIPKEKRDLRTEKLVKKRLWEHFSRHHEKTKKEKKEIINKGLFFVATGIALMIIATFILFKYEKSILTSFLTILLEPAGWFFFWEGLREIIFESKIFTNDIEFYQKMSKCDIEFVNH